MRLLPPFGRPVHRLEPDAEEGHEGATEPPERLRPEVGDPSAGPRGRKRPAPAGEALRGHANMPADAGNQLFGREAVPRRERLHLAPDLFDECRTAEDALIPPVGLSAPPEGLHRRPAAGNSERGHPPAILADAPGGFPQR